MHLDHFGLVTDPFSLTPRLEFLFLSGAYEESCAHLAYGLEHHEAITLITGAIGTGKTLIIHSFLDNLSDTYATALVNTTHVDFRELMKLILDDLGIKVRPEADRADLLRILKDHVVRANQLGKRILVIVDEAQVLSLDALDGLRMLTNLDQSSGQGLQLVLVGQPELERKLALPELAPLRQRIRIHYRLETLSRKEVGDYVHHRLKVAGNDQKLFDGGALDKIFELSMGVPRLVNVLAGEALLAAYVEGDRKIRARHVDPSVIGAPALESPRAEAPRKTVPGPGRAPAPEPPELLRPPADAAPARPPQPVAGERDADFMEPAVPETPSRKPADQKPSPLPWDDIPGFTAAVDEDEEPAAAAPPPRRRGRAGAGIFVGAAVVVVVAMAAAWFFVIRPRDGSASAGYPSPATETAAPGLQAGDSTGTLAADAALVARDAVADSVPAGKVSDREETTPVTTAPATPDHRVADSGSSPAGSPAGARGDARAATGTASGQETPAGPAGGPAAATPAAATAEEAPADAESESPGPHPFGDWYVAHIGSFQEPDRAENLCTSLRGRGIDAFLMQTILQGKRWYRVFIGPYRDAPAARTAVSRLERPETDKYYEIVKYQDVLDQ